MFRLPVVLLAFLLPSAVLAQPVVPGQPLGQPVGPQDSDILRRSTRSLPPDVPPTPIAPPPAGAHDVAVDRELCAQLSIEHQPAPDVTYRPGVDVYGRPVAPADLPSTSPTYGGLGSRTSTDILVAPQSGGLNQRGLVGETFVGRVTVDPYGNVTINGEPVGPQAQTELRRRCASAGY